VTVIAERSFTVTVKVEAANVHDLDEATVLLAQKLAWWPGRLAGFKPRIISTVVTRA
jgi:hypothetical protein